LAESKSRGILDVEYLQLSNMAHIQTILCHLDSKSYGSTNRENQTLFSFLTEFAQSNPQTEISVSAPK